MSRRKPKSTPAGGKFAQVPVRLAKSVMVELTAPELRVWLALSLQCLQWANGTGKLCRSVIREFGLGSQRNVTAATKKLIASGRIVLTRAARQRKCALYGVTHLPLNTDALAREGLDQTAIRAALRKFGEAIVISDSDRGSAKPDTTAEALISRIDNTGSARPNGTALVLPKPSTFTPNPPG